MKEVIDNLITSLGISLLHISNTLIRIEPIEDIKEYNKSKSRYYGG